MQTKRDMRLKNNPKAKEAIKTHPLVIQSPESLKGQWHSSFPKFRSIFIEIGCGKGQFILQKALLDPHNLYIGIEQFETVLYKAVRKPGEHPPANLRFICFHAEHLQNIFSHQEVQGIFLNFSDPWPKKRHAKRRLTSDRFLPIYKDILCPGGTIEFKTDNHDLYYFTLETLKDSKDFRILDYTDDLYNNPVLFSGNTATEYEEKFHGLGKKICKVIMQ